MPNGCDRRAEGPAVKGPSGRDVRQGAGRRERGRPERGEATRLRAHLGSLTDERRGHPQMVIRLGYGPDGPASPRARWAAPEAGAEGGDPSSR
ncbi:hypothetical protein GCM10010350_37760 [Streptomyces galilaeus]|nr:hypothetical protein GCM10010350_37760 [Streptomyces galilaeus]